MSMKKMILDRLIETIKADADVKVREAEDRVLQNGKMTAELRMELARTSSRLTATTNDLKLLSLRLNTSQADAPLTELYRAAENMMEAKTLEQYKAARPRLSQAMDASSKYIDLIPF